jgi:DNA-binding winged helix-turn-helix (wHTH) protein/tetratricopeptide (TPR) repeat protein
MNPPLTPPFRLGPFEIEPALNEVRNAEERRTLEPKAMDLLVLLARRAGDTVSKDEILAAVWGGAFVSDGVVAKNVSALRSVLDDDTKEPRFIVTVARRGYRLVAPVEWRTAPEPSTGPLPSRPRRWPYWLAAVALVVGLVAAVDLWRKTLDDPRTIERLAVLPFEGPFEEGLGSDERLHLADALHDEVVNLLARLPRPRVLLVTRDELARRGLADLTRTLPADALLEGRVEARGEGLRITARLLDSESHEVLWVRTWENASDDLAAVRGKIAREVATGARAQLDPRSRAAKLEVDPAAYRDFLRARWHWQRRGLEDLHRAHQLFLSATEKDPAFAQGFAGLAQCLVTLANYGQMPLDLARKRAGQATDHALGLDPESPEAFTARGLIRYQWDWDFEGAAEDYERAVELTPGPTPARQFLAEAYVALGRHDEALAAIDEAIDREPYSPLLLAVKGLVLHAAGRPAEALAVLDDALGFDPRFFWLHLYRDYSLQELGRPSEAAQARAHRRGGPDLGPELAVAADRGLAEVRRWELLELARPENRRTSGNAFQLAEVLAGLGRFDESLTELERAMADRGEFFHLLRSPAFDPYRADPRFRQLLAANGLTAAASRRPPCRFG